MSSILKYPDFSLTLSVFPDRRNPGNCFVQAYNVQVWKFTKRQTHEIGVKARRNAPKCCYGARKFKHRAFWLKSYWISEPEPTFLGPAAFAVVIRQLMSHSNSTFYNHKFTMPNACTKFYKTEKKHEFIVNTFSPSLII